MSKYTTTLYHIVKSGFDLGLRQYPIFDEEYRPILNKEIIDYYLMFEIGQETPFLFRHYLNTQMQLIMPKYNIMYKAQQDIMQSPLGNVNLTETFDRNIVGQNNGKIESDGNNSSNSTFNGKNLFQDTPAGKLSHTDIDEQKWATNLNLAKNNTSDNSILHTTNTSEDNRNTTEEYVKTIIGNNGRKYNAEIYLKLINDFKNIDQLVIKELDDLFMGVL